MCGRCGFLITFSYANIVCLKHIIGGRKREKSKAIRSSFKKGQGFRYVDLELKLEDQLSENV